MTEPKLQTPSPPHTDRLGVSGNWHSGWTQSLIPIDTGAAFSLLTSFKGPLQPSEVAIEGISGIPFYPKITPPLLCSFDKTTLTHSYKVVSRCLMALMGCDLLAKLQTSINLPSLDPVPILCIEMAPEPLASPHSQNLPPGLPLIDPQVWDFKAPSVAQHHSPIQFFFEESLSGHNPNSAYPDHRIPRT